MHRLLIAITLLFLNTAAYAHEHKPHWEAMPQYLKDWYSSLTRPDMPPNWSCCGLADAYWADEIEVKDGVVIVTITDDRDDKPLGRPHIPVGTKVIIPKEKMVDLFKGPNAGKGNPTGHSIVFIGGGNINNVYCFVTGMLT
jgi:hypothetical protein